MQVKSSEIPLLIPRYNGVRREHDKISDDS
ncbi:Uncharacterised protein [Yersinia frederiksenii]|uniref:Uncharacterized protein n=1 Tax=Yersinia frederiksenii TaxID=29484 RepID=A0AAI8ZV80_YERFR|nr:Uncharacterised protein [Yersinia frederiksenii]CFR32010.1 Uncharacterised protein [Yersinia frederiksenii]CNG05675.1 Uncharacterised protein [Yersinia frederiksenii]CNK53163.1 Uncharacterised protein [Yersinia frederiksenii]CQH20250.1 Uncharacterised protein [Yersinia frederiksenii]